MESLLADIRYGVRSLLKHPGFTAIAIATLALGIGTNTAIFSLVNAVLLKPLPYKDPQQLVLVWEDASDIGFPRADPAPGNYADWKTQQTVFESMAAVAPRSYSLTGDGDPERVMANAITADLFPLLGSAPQLGRNFTADEDKPGGPNVVLLSHGIWQSRYAGDRGIVGREILLDDQKYTVVGVMPTGFQFLSNTVGLWVPLALTPQQLADRDSGFLRVVGRMKPGVTAAQANTEIQTITQRIIQQDPENAQLLKATVVPLHDQIVSTVQRPMWMLVVAAGLVLLIACANIANLQLTRATGRDKEMALRSALGASRFRILRQLLVESVILACVGGAAGLTLAIWSFSLLKELVPPSLTFSADLKINLPVLGFTFFVSLLTGVAFGLAPALQASKVDLNESLKQGGGRATSGRKGNRLRGAFVVAEVALALVLLVGAGLMIQTVYHMLHQYSSYEPERLLTLRTVMADSKFRDLKRYQTEEHPKRIAFYDQVLQRVNTLPGVVSASYTTAVPLTWKGGASGLELEIRPTQPGVRNPNAIHRQISPGFFQTIGVPLREGRYFDEHDREGSTPVAIVNESLAREWRGLSPVGQRFRLGTTNAPWITVVGVVPDVRQMGMDIPVKSEMYFPYSQVSTHPFFAPRDLVIRTNGEASGIVAAVRREIAAVDKNQPISNVATWEEILVRDAGPRRLGMILLTAFAALALLLACLGIYGVLSFFVVQQTRDIGVRIALGAQLRHVLGLVVKRGMAWTVIGIAVGVAAAIALSRLMTGLLFGVRAADPATFIGITLLLTAVALLASYIPARRASKVDPIIALRQE